MSYLKAVFPLPLLNLFTTHSLPLLPRALERQGGEWQEVGERQNLGRIRPSLFAAVKAGRRCCAPVWQAKVSLHGTSLALAATGRHWPR